MDNLDTIRELNETMAALAELKAVMRYHEKRAKLLRSLLIIEGNEARRLAGYKAPRMAVV